MARINQVEWLEAFVALTDHGTFTRAARSLHVAQSRVSARIADLERALGQQLIDRRRRPVVLTDSGIAFLPHARSVLTALERACDDLDALSEDIRGHVVLGTHPSISAGFMPLVLREFTRLHPGVTIDLTERTAAQLLVALQEGTVDLAVRAETGETSPSSLTCAPLWGEPYAFVVRDDHPLAQATAPADPVTLFSQPLIGISPPGGQLEPELIRLAARWNAATPRLAWRTEQPQTLVNLVREGLGVGVVNHLAFLTSEHHEVVKLLVAGDPKARIVGLWWDSHRHHSVAMRVLARFIQDFPTPEGTIPIPPDEDHPETPGRDSETATVQDVSH